MLQLSHVNKQLVRSKRFLHQTPQVSENGICDWPLVILRPGLRSEG